MGLRCRGERDRLHPFLVELTAINGKVVSEALSVDELPRGRREEGARGSALQGWKRDSHTTGTSCPSQIMEGHPVHLHCYFLDSCDWVSLMAPVLQGCFLPV